jgi:hypothetical protein
MTLERNPTRLFGMALLTLALTGCAQVIGIEDFTVGDGASTEGGSSSGGQPVDICEAVHGCTYNEDDPLMNHIGAPELYISFNATQYDPRCAIVDDGTSVVFKSETHTFNDIPLSGGVFPKVDPESPLKTPADPTKTEEAFTLSGKCAYPYFSTTNGLTGVIFIAKP